MYITLFGQDGGRWGQFRANVKIRDLRAVLSSHKV